MKKALVFSAIAAAAVSAMAQSGGPADASSREMGRVISTTPVVQQVPLTQQVCGSQQVVTQAPPSGAGAVLGGIAGGVLGNAIGGGGGRAAATALGIVGGAVLGSSAEGPGQAYVQNVPTCSTQTTYENRTVGYDVTYEYAGRRYNTRMASDPGQYVPVQVGTVNDNPPQQASGSYNGQPGTIEQGVVLPAYSSVPAPVIYTQTYAPAYVPAYAPVYAPGYYGGGYGGGYGYGGVPIGLSIGLGYSRGYGGYGHGYGGGRGRWR